MKQKLKFWEVVQISLCIVGALMFGMLLALPVLINLEMKLSIIDFLHRH